MPIFGQVWLWSSLAFLLGAVLCWLLVARPARSRVGELEAQLATRARRQSAVEHPEPPRRRHDEEAEFSRSLVPGLSDRPVGEDSEYLTRSYALRDNPPLPPERDPLGRYEEPEPGSPGRDFAPLPPEHAPETAQTTTFSGLSAPPEPGAEVTQSGPSAAATQYLDVSAGSLTAPPEVPSMSPPPSDRGWFDDELEGDAANQAPEEQPALPRNRHQLDESLELNDSRLVDDDVDAIGDALDAQEPAEPRSAIEDDSGGTVFTQRTHPIPGELIRQIDEAGKAERAEAESTYAESTDDGLVDDLADEPGDEVAKYERTVESEPVAPVVPPPAQEVETTGASHALVEPEPEVASAPELPQERTEVVAAVTEKPASDLPRRVPKQNRITPGVAVRVEPTPSASALPKRVPGKPRHQVPFGVQPSSTPEPAPEPAPAAAAAVDEVPDSPRSLFEPIVPAADEGTSTPPPPHRLRQGSGGGRGPFGPGSAMPLPGGASPSPEFTIKASVAALRYCTPESPQFGRTVAEVWFRTAADAERVGFRPVG
ncbi:hypothetical protein [Actinophytocola sp. NPDC049390]|uniref:sunset domain-containing protein n=1 Tax=Actinophytocola sp. NPDC049390 TaxID=3363894 RepID=UPI0037AC7A19